MRQEEEHKRGSTFNDDCGVLFLLGKSHWRTTTPLRMVKSLGLALLRVPTAPREEEERRGEERRPSQTNEETGGRCVEKGWLPAPAVRR